MQKLRVSGGEVVLRHARLQGGHAVRQEVVFVRSRRGPFLHVHVRDALPEEQPLRQAVLHSVSTINQSQRGTASPVETLTVVLWVGTLQMISDRLLWGQRRHSKTYCSFSGGTSFVAFNTQILAGVRGPRHAPAKTNQSPFDLDGAKNILFPWLKCTICGPKICFWICSSERSTTTTAYEIYH